MLRPSRGNSEISPSAIRSILSTNRKSPVGDDPFKKSISFGIGQVDFKPPDYAIDAMTKYLREPTAFCYGLTGGYQPFLDSVAKRYCDRYSLDVLPENVLPTVGATQALGCVLSTYLSPGDKVLITNPRFIVYPEQVKLRHSNFITTNLKPNTKHIDVEDIIKKIEEQNPKIIILNTPDNPTGTVQPKKFIKEVIDAARKNNSAVIADEVYDEYTYGVRHSCALEHGFDNVIVINSMSKTAGMHDQRLGYIVADKDVIEHLSKTQQYEIACVSKSFQAGAAEFFNNQETLAFIKRNVASLEIRRNIMGEGLRHVGFNLPTIPEGAFYFFPSLPLESKGLTSIQFAQKMLNRINLKSVPGMGFGEGQENYLRFSYSTSEGDIKEGLERMKIFLKEEGFG